MASRKYFCHSVRMIHTSSSAHTFCVCYKERGKKNHFYIKVQRISPLLLHSMCRHVCVCFEGLRTTIPFHFTASLYYSAATLHQSSIYDVKTNRISFRQSRDPLFDNDALWSRGDAFLVLLRTTRRRRRCYFFFLCFPRFEDLIFFLSIGRRRRRLQRHLFFFA